LQQVKPTAKTAAIAIARPYEQGALVRRSPTSLQVRARHIWVLHKQLLVRLSALLLVVVIGAACIANRHALANYFQDLTARGSAMFAQAGLSVGQISLSGYALTNEEQIFQAIGLEPHQSIVGFDADAARDRLLELPSITAASVRKIYPDSLIVELEEKLPLAIWTVDGVNFAIDGKGERIATLSAPIEGLPLFVGDGAADDVPQMLQMLETHALLKEGLLASSRIGDRRWDLIYENGVRIMLPEKAVADAMKTATALIQPHNIFDRHLAVIDLRVKAYVAIRPIADVAAEEENES
jgi:cell division protein FtsQ